MNIDYGTGSRIYTLGVSGEATDGVSFNIPLVDTQGELVACNYVDVALVGSGNAAGETTFVTVELSGIGASSPSVQVSGITTERASFGATCGFTLVAPGASDGSVSRYCWHGWRNDTVKGLKCTAVSTNSTRTVDLSVTYGNLIPYNKKGDPWVDIIGT